MRNVARLLTLFLTTSVAFFGWSAKAETQRSFEASAAPYSSGISSSSASRGVNAAQLYARNCARCHGEDGSGDTQLGRVYGAPDFTDAGWWQRHGISNSALARIVTNGKGGMPSFRKKLGQPEITALVAYVRHFAQR